MSDLNTNSAFSLVLHVGAHIGQEVESYRNLGVENIIWIEADPNTYSKLQMYVSSQENGAAKKINHTFVNALISDKDGELIKFHTFNNDGQSSSRFKPTDILRNAWPGLDTIGAPKEFKSYRLDTVLSSLNLSDDHFSNAKLVLDVQGGEYEALIGLGIYLTKFNCIEIEIPRSEIYEGQKLFESVDSLLNLSSFKRNTSNINDVPWHGNIVYTINKNEAIINQHCQKYFTSLYAFREIQKNNSLQFPLTDFVNFCAKQVDRSHAQLFQDLLVLFLLRNKRGGYFVEFGATDGLYLSNTYLLEKEYGWNGILCEPATSWHSKLEASRSVSIDKRCVYGTSNEFLDFLETNEQELSTLANFSDKDLHSASRAGGKAYKVQTVSLTDLLDSYASPDIIDYISIDTEGSEFEILSKFNFSKYKFRVITVEHNYTNMREEIYSLLINHGYMRIFSTISSFDDWYIHPDLIALKI